jgi:dipeptidase D
MSFVAQLEPRSLWSHFDRLLTIPRGSKHEERARAYVLEVAGRLKLETRTDATGNVVVRKPAARGRDRAPTVILQAHLDMVQEKQSDVAHDFATDAIVPRRDGPYLYATGTTLGADNGIGVAAMLATLDAPDLDHGPLELLFTVDEETGLTGAQQLDPTLLTGGLLLNLDSEEEGILTVGCAGGADSRLTLPIRTSRVSADGTATRVRVHGLKGGHSGVDIHLQRGNALQVLARILLAGMARQPAMLASLKGGGAHNAIPREATAVIVAPAGDGDRFVAALRDEFGAVQQELKAADPGAALEISDTPTPATVFAPDAATATLNLLFGLPHGVLAMSAELPGLVETSNNVATVAARDGALLIGTSSRSSVDTALEATRRRVRAVAELAGATVEEPPAYPGWKPDMSSRLLGVMRTVHTRVLDKEPAVSAIHAGLECGIIGRRKPGLDMISFGPQIEFPHSPDERVHIASVGRFWKLLLATLGELATS